MLGLYGVRVILEGDGIALFVRASRERVKLSRVIFECKRINHQPKFILITYIIHSALSICMQDITFARARTRPKAARPNARATIGYLLSFIQPIDRALEDIVHIQRI